MQPKTKRVLLAMVFAAAAIVFTALLWRGPWWIDGAHLRTDNLEPADGVVITGFRTTLVALGAGVVAGLGLYYTHRAHQQTKELFEHTRNKDREQAELVREGQVTERYVEAIKLLSSENLTQQLGGIYALERIMQDSEKDRRTVIEVLSAFIRDDPVHPVMEEQGEETESSRQRRAAVQAALVALSRRPSAEEMAFNLEGSDLRGLNAVHLNLRGAYLARARLDGLRGQGVDLRGAYLGRVNLQEADLEDARLEESDLRFANLTRVRFGAAALAGVEWSGADLTGATLNAASGLTAEALSRARLTSKTRLPLGLTDDDRIRRRIEECDNEQHKLEHPQ
jgi:hypothetical protein